MWHGYIFWRLKWLFILTLVIRLLNEIRRGYTHCWEISAKSFHTIFVHPKCHENWNGDKRFTITRMNTSCL